MIVTKVQMQNVEALIFTRISPSFQSHLALNTKPPSLDSEIQSQPGALCSWTGLCSVFGLLHEVVHLGC